MTDVHSFFLGSQKFLGLDLGLLVQVYMYQVAKLIRSYDYSPYLILLRPFHRTARRQAYTIYTAGCDAKTALFTSAWISVIKY